MWSDDDSAPRRKSNKHITHLNRHRNGNNEEEEEEEKESRHSKEKVESVTTNTNKKNTKKSSKNPSTPQVKAIHKNPNLNPEEEKRLTKTNKTEEDDDNLNGVQTTVLNDFDRNLELLSEKRASTRESSLEAINKALSIKFSYDFVSKSRVSILEALKKSLQKGGPNERQLSARTLSLVTITLGTETEDIFTEFRPILQEIIKHHPTPSVSSAAIQCLSTVCFVGVTDHEVTMDCLVFLESLLNSNEKIYEAVLQAWAILATTLSSYQLNDIVFPRIISNFVSLLEIDDLDIREAVGENIALLFQYQRDSDGYFDVYNYEGFLNPDELLTTLDNLASEASRYQAKKERAKQRSIFRYIKSSIEEGITPEETLSFKHQKIHFRGWDQIIQLNFFRDCLTIGFQEHFVQNELLHDVFDATINKDFVLPHLSAIEKRQTKSPSSLVSKERAINRTKQRRNRQSQLTNELL